MSKHEEFPKLTPEAMAACVVASIPFSNWIHRQSLAAFLREAMKQAKDQYGGFHLDKLRAIADNLHSPPPPPPTLAQAREAARQLGGANAEIVHAFLATLEGTQP